MSHARNTSEPETDGTASTDDSRVRAVADASGVEGRDADRIGQRLGRFEILARIGAGGMGVVYCAEDLERGGRVALKVAPDAFVADPQRARRFAAEAAAIAALDHPAIVRYVAHGTAPSGEPFLAMEWLEGEDLAQHLRRGGLGIRESAALGLRVAEALAVAHAQGIVHRDIKPSNIFLRGGDPAQPTLLDFGIVRADDAPALTLTGAMMGTLGYMAPEQARAGAKVDARADVFSLGCVLFECLTGEPPFAGIHPLATLAKLLFEETPRVHEWRPEVPERLAALLDRMLAKNADDRPKDGQAVVELLHGLGDLPDVTPNEWPRRASRPEALTDSEERAAAVILIGAPKLQGDDAMTAVKNEAMRHGGHFEGFMDGSGAVLLKGNALATDLATQAARCALALRERTTTRSIALALRLGHTAERSVGNTIDRAARLVGGSSPSDVALGTTPIVLDDVTAGLLDARFDVRESESGLVLQGEHELAEGTRTLLGKATPCVGRDLELGILDQLFEACTHERVAQAVLVTAPAGVGKSRFLHEFLRRVRDRDEPVAISIGRGDPLRAGSAYGMLGQLLRRAAGIQDGAPLEVRRERLLARVGERVAEAERRRVAEFLGELIGTPFEDSPPLAAARQDAQLMNVQMREAFLTFLAAECEARPTLVVLEDLHWGDWPTVDLLDHALKELRDKSLFVLALARPEVHERFRNLWHKQPLQTIRLRELTEKAASRLARHVLGERVDATLIERLAKLSEGNAFYLEELIRSAAEGRGAYLPETVVAMVQSRFAVLDDEARRLLRPASVFGEVFWAEGVATLLGGVERASRVRERLRDLVAREILTARQESRFPGQEEYAFRHALLREGAYAMLTSEDRVLGHRLAGAWLEQHGESDMLVLAEHFEWGEEPERAAAFYARAADQAIAGNDLAGALAHAERGLVSCAEGPTSGALLACQTAAHFWRADFSAVDRCGTEALGQLDAGSSRWCTCVVQVCLAAIQQHDLARFAALSQTLCNVDPAPEASAAYVQAAAFLSVIWSGAGARTMASAILERMDRIHAGGAPTDASALGWRRYATAFYGYVLTPDPWGVYVTSGEALDYFKTCGDRRMMAGTGAGLGVVQAELFGLRTAEETLRAGMTAMVQLNEIIAFAYIGMHLALLLAEQGAPERLDEAYALASEIVDKVPGNTIYGGIAHAALARVHVRRDDLSAAEACARRAREMLSPTPGMAPPAFVAQIDVLSRQRRTAEARAVAEEGLELIRSVGGTGTTELRLRLAAAEARYADGDHDAAREAIESALIELHKRADAIPLGVARAHFLEQVPSHARIVELARLWKVG